MIDTKTFFKEMARLLGENPDSFYSRLSVAKYYEIGKGGKNGLPWNWMAKVGLENKDSVFSARMTSFGILDLHSINKSMKEQVRRLVQSYDDYLMIKMPKVIKTLNTSYLHPIAKTNNHSINTLGLFKTMAKISHHDPSDFYSRLTVAKHYETIEESEKDNPWYWSDKVGLKDDSFTVHMTRYNVENPDYILSNPAISEDQQTKLYTALLKYKNYLRVIMKPIYHMLNDKFINPAD